jgi:hypothetical protein
VSLSREAGVRRGSGFGFRASSCAGIWCWTIDTLAPTRAAAPFPCISPVATTVGRGACLAVAFPGCGRLRRASPDARCGRGPGARSRGCLTLASAGQSRGDVSVRRVDCGSSAADVRTSPADTLASSRQRKRGHGIRARFRSHGSPPRRTEARSYPSCDVPQAGETSIVTSLWAWGKAGGGAGAAKAERPQIRLRRAAALRAS